jgi:hypothetical protein
LFPSHDQEAIMVAIIIVVEAGEEELLPIQQEMI